MINRNITMNNLKTMTWGEFKARLLDYTELHLEFNYQEGMQVDNSFHITEIKLAPITSVDCGGVLNKWTEVIVQLWEPDEKQAGRSMKVSKAISIIDIVEKALPLDPAAIVKIEFGNSQFDTRQMFPADINVAGDTLTVRLTPDAVQCKAQTRGGSCGTDEKGEECCVPEKEKVKMVNLATPSVAGCTPGNGCC